MTRLGQYAHRFDAHLAFQVPTAVDAARALYSLNREVKTGAGLVYQATVYSLKAGLLEAFCRENRAVRITYDAYAEPKPVWGFTFAVADGRSHTLYQWHCIAEDVDWGPLCIDVPPPGNLRAAAGLDTRPMAARLETIRLYLVMNGRTR